MGLQLLALEESIDQDYPEKEDEAKEDAFLLRNWSYSNLKQKIEYKATKAGITLIVE